MKVGSGGGDDKRADDGRANDPAPEKGGGAGTGPGTSMGLVAKEHAYDIRIARDGTWYHEGDPIRRPELVRLFASVLRRDDAGDFWLVTPVERGRIVVEDTPFVVVEMNARGCGEDQVLSFRTNLDEWVEAGPDYPIRVVHNPHTGEPIPYIDIRNRLEARILRSVYYEMVDRSVPSGQGRDAEVGLWSKKAFFALGKLPGD